MTLQGQPQGNGRVHLGAATGDEAPYHSQACMCLQRRLRAQAPARKHTASRNNSPLHALHTPWSTGGSRKPHVSSVCKSIAWRCARKRRESAAQRMGGHDASPVSRQAHHGGAHCGAEAHPEPGGGCMSVLSPYLRCTEICTAVCASPHRHSHRKACRNNLPQGALTCDVASVHPWL